MLLDTRGGVCSDKKEIANRRLCQVIDRRGAAGVPKVGSLRSLGGRRHNYENNRKSGG